MADTSATNDPEHVGDAEAPKGIAAGAAIGLVVGGVLGWQLGIGAVALPGIGPAAAGPIVAALAAIGIAGATGGVVGALVSARMSKDSERYQ